MVLGNNVTNIGTWSFGGCSELTRIDFPKNLITIEEGAFYACSKLTRLTIPDLVTVIGSQAFHDCGSLTNVVVGKGVSAILNYSFGACPKLTSVYFKGNAPTLGSAVFLPSPATIYYVPSTLGWTNPWAGLPTVPWPIEITAPELVESRVVSFALNFIGRLQRSTNLINWDEVPGAVSGSYRVHTTNDERRFFRYLVE